MYRKFLCFVCCVLVSASADYIALVNKIKSGVLAGHSFSHVNQSEVIIMDDCDLREIELSAFENVRISKLNITGNPLEEITKGVFVNAFINEMFLMANKITNIEKGSFDDIHPLKGDRIETLSLAFNSLETITSGVFNGTKFSSLFFSHNKIVYIEPDAFSDMHQLHRIDLIGNYLQKIDVGVFQNLALETASIWLDFGQNKITFIDPRAFDNTSLMTLGLQDNHLGLITKNYFRNTNINVIDI